MAFPHLAVSGNQAPHGLKFSMNSIDSCGKAKNEPSPITKWLVETRNHSQNFTVYVEFTTPILWFADGFKFQF
jgi:hypothetical protein